MRAFSAPGILYSGLIGTRTGRPGVLYSFAIVKPLK